MFNSSKMVLTYGIPDCDRFPHGMGTYYQTILI